MKPDNNELDKYLSDESFQKWLNGNADPEEKARWQSWLKINSAHETIYNEAVAVWQSARFGKKETIDIDSAWHNIEKNIHPVTEKTGYRKDKTKYKKINTMFYFRAAAVFLIFTTLVFLLYRDFIIDDNQPVVASVKTTFGEQQQINLPDGSTVIINANSILKYPDHWTADTEPVYYLDGEAFFSIARQTVGKICRVITKDGEIRVLGTRFSVNCRKTNTRISLEKGRVEVVAADSMHSSEAVTPKVRLNPGQYINFHNGMKNLQVKKETEPLFLNWWQPRFIFKETCFSQVKERLEQTYNLNIKVEDQSLLQRKLSGTIEKDDLDIVLQAIALILQAEYHKEGRIVVFNKTQEEL